MNNTNQTNNQSIMKRTLQLPYIQQQDLLSFNNSRVSTNSFNLNNVQNTEYKRSFQYVLEQLDMQETFNDFYNNFVLEKIQNKRQNVSILNTADNKKNLLTLVFKLEKQDPTIKKCLLTKQKKDIIKIDNEIYIKFQWDNFMAYGTEQQKRLYNDFRMKYIQTIDSFNGCEYNQVQGKNKHCDPGTGSVSPVSDIDYTVIIDDPSTVIYKTYQLHSMIFPKYTLSEMFDVNYYGTNFILSLSEEQSKTLKQNPSPYLKNVKDYIKSQTFKQQYSSDLFYIPDKNIFNQYRWNRFAEYSLKDYDIKIVMNNIINKLKMEYQCQEEVCIRLKVNRLSTHNLQSGGNSRRTLTKKSAFKVEQNNIKTVFTKHTSPQQQLQSYIQEIHDQYELWTKIQKKILEKAQQMDMTKEQVKEQLYTSKMQKYVQMRKQFLNKLLSGTQNENEIEKISADLLSIIAQTQIYSREQYYTIASMLFVQHGQIKLPDFNEVENAVIDNLGFIIELTHEKKACVEPVTFYMKVSKYLERIYLIIHNFSPINPNRFEVFTQLNKYRKDIAKGVNVSQTDLQTAIERFEMRYSINTYLNKYHYFMLENIIWEILNYLMIINNNFQKQQNNIM